jgi:hypothetical protein
MKKTVSDWKYKLIGINENLEIHLLASMNNEYTCDMRDYARSRVLSLTKYKELIERTIELLEGV